MSNIKDAATTLVEELKQRASERGTLSSVSLSDDEDAALAAIVMTLYLNGRQKIGKFALSPL